jgi:hypothetical protein
VPQGVSADLIATLEGFSRADVDASRCARTSARQRPGRRALRRSIVPVHDIAGLLMLDEDETIRPGTSLESLAKLMPSFEMMGTMGFDATALRKYTTVERIQHVHHAGNSSGIVDGAALMLVGSKAAGIKAGLKPRARIRAVRGHRLRAHHHADRPHARLPQGAGQGRHGGQRHRPVGDQRGLRHRADEDRARPGRRRSTASTSTAAPSPWATRWAPPAASSWAPLLDELERRNLSTGWPRCASAAAWASPPSSNGLIHALTP